jgi:hypothetical protein
MESGLGKLRLRWNVLRLIAAAIAIATFTLILVSIPAAISILWILALLIGIAVSTVALAKCNVIWSRITLLAQVILFALALLSAISTGGPADEVPILLLAFVMILGTEQGLSLLSNYGAQFSLTNSAYVTDFNIPTLQRSLDRLYRRLAWNGVIFGAAYLLALTVASIGSLLSPVAPPLSDISVYVLVTAISLAILIVLRDE